MKYGKLWQQTVVFTIPQDMRFLCLDYKRYKKLIKNATVVSVFHIWKYLYNIKTIDTKLYNIFKQVKAHLSCTDNNVSNYVQQNDDKMNINDTFVNTLLKLKLLNEKTIYKLQKRIKKRMFVDNDKNSRLNYKMILSLFANAQFKFLCLSNVTTWIQHAIFQLANEVHECPICFNEFSNMNHFVTKCGHVVCIDCALCMTNAHVLKKGTFHNKLAHGIHSLGKPVMCPLCRDQSAFHNYQCIHKSYALHQTINGHVDV